jgi:RNA polymerase sigma factor (sigma-70 family)
MDAQTDAQLLRAYAEHRADAAFAELVRRHIDLVHSAARRMVGDTHLAEDVTQATFLALAKNAAQLTERPVLAGWLHRTAQNIAAQTVRTDVRRRAREQEAAAMNELLADSGTVAPPAWSEIAPHLDAALGELTEPERDAVLLRYFQRQSARDMAQTLGISDEAAQKRVSRAVERLREFFAKRGVTVGAGGLAVVISANAVQAAPVGLALTISTAAALTGTALVTTATVTATKAIAMTALQKTAVAATIAVLAGAGIYELRQATQLREQVLTLQQQQAPLAEQIAQLNQSLIDATNRMATLRDDNERLNRNTSELLRLRGEVGLLRSSSGAAPQRSPNKDEMDELETAMKAWLDRVDAVKRRLDEMPDKKIPELQYLTAEDWLEVSKGYGETDQGSNIRRVLAELRRRAKLTFAIMAGQALNDYIIANNGYLPDDLSQLKPHFKTQIPDEMLERYSLRHTGKLASISTTECIISEKHTVDDREDTLFTIGAYGWSWEGTGLLTIGKVEGSWDTSAIKAFMKQ